MKTMTCKQLGGPCDHAFKGKNADEIIKMQDAHLKEMVAGGEESHKQAAEDMKKRWRNPLKGMGWYLSMKKAFAALPEESI